MLDERPSKRERFNFEALFFLSKRTSLSMSFEAYENNGGTCVCVAGDDFCVVAADTRMSEGYSIHTRHYHKLVRL